MNREQLLASIEAAFRNSLTSGDTIRLRSSWDGSVAQVGYVSGDEVFSLDRLRANLGQVGKVEHFGLHGRGGPPGTGPQLRVSLRTHEGVVEIVYLLVGSGG